MTNNRTRDLLGQEMYTMYGNLSATELIQLAAEQRKRGETYLLQELADIDKQARDAYEAFQDLSRQRSKLVLAISEAGVPQSEIAEALGLSRQRVYTLLKQGRKASDKD